MTAILNELKALDADASDLERRLRDLKGLTPEFETALDRAKSGLENHLCMIESETLALAGLRERAVELAAHIGRDEMGAEVIDHDTGREPEPEALTAEDEAAIEAVLNDDTPFAGCAEPEAEPIQPDPIYAYSYDERVAAVEEITESLSELADEPPETPDASDEPEMTHEECEAYEESIREADRVPAE